MNFFRNNPFVRILLFALAGILLANYAAKALLIFALVIPAVAIGYARLRRLQRYPFDVLASSLLACLVLLIFAADVLLRKPVLPVSGEAVSGYLARVDEAPSPKSGRLQSVWTILQAENDTLSGKRLLVTLDPSAMTEPLHPGDVLLCRSRVIRLSNAGNPFEFDYAGYMARQGYFFRSFLRKGEFEQTGQRDFSVTIRAERAREYLLQLLHQKLKKSESLEVIPALTLGYRKDIQSETNSWFIATGAMHVLSVSGLHVGLIYLFISFCLSFLDRSKGGRLFKTVLILVFLWVYALITGFSPSVQRATLMFSFLLIGQSLNRRSSMYNSIAASAFFLLLFDPDILFQLSFQLSYAAVISIVYFYGKFEKLLSVKNPVIRWFWQLTCVSVAAQAGTFPISIFYFHQFPLYFWLSNFVVIPAGFVLLAGSLLLLVLYPIPVLPDWLGFVLDQTNWVMLRALEWISNLPFAVWSGVPLTTIQFGCLMALMLSLVFWIEYRRKATVFAVLGLVLLVQVAGFYEKVSLFNQQRVIDYRGKSPVYQLVSGRENYVLSADSALLTAKRYQGATQQLQLNPPVFVWLSPGCRFDSPPLLLDQTMVQFGETSYRVQFQKKKQPVLLSENRLPPTRR